MEYEIRAQGKDGFFYFSEFSENHSMITGQFMKWSGYHHRIKPMRFKSIGEAQNVMDSILRIENRKWISDTGIKLLNGSSKPEWKISEVKHNDK